MGRLERHMVTFGFLIAVTSLLSVNHIESAEEQNTSSASGFLEGPFNGAEKDTPMGNLAKGVQNSAAPSGTDEESVVIEDVDSANDIDQLVNHIGPVSIKNAVNNQFWNFTVDNSGRLRFRANQRQGGPTRLIINDNNGNVGIGTPSPQTKLDVRGHLMLEAGGNPILWTGTGGAELNRYLALLNSPNFTSGSGLKASGVLVSDTFAFANPGKNDLIVKGNVSIGTTAQDAKLTILAQGDGARVLTLATERGWVFKQRGTGASTALELTASTSSNNNKNFIINTEGRVGIGTTAPHVKFDVNGRIGVHRVDVWDGTDDNDLTWDGRTITREGSSRRYKKNITPLDADFHKILDLEPKKFQMREGFGEPGKWTFGYIAEDLDSLGLKRLCNYDNEKRPDGVKYKKIAMYVLEVVKEQQNELMAQKSELITLKSENTQLKERLTALADQQEALENMFLALSANPHKHKQVTYDEARSDEAHMDLQ